MHYVARYNIHGKTLEHNAKCSHIDLNSPSHTVAPINSCDQENLYFKTHIRKNIIEVERPR